MTKGTRRTRVQRFKIYLIESRLNWWPQIISNEELWERTIKNRCRDNANGWIGHTLRKSQNEICHSVLEWNLQGRRS